ncbi:MAG TPA: hemolysin family protein [Kofleriaceae bacterium]|nr:hemolysin family protein [Kofleriaceae bacterium]
MIDTETWFFVIGLCLLVQAFSVGAEAALGAANRGRLRQRAQEGNWSARAAERLATNPRIALATTLITASAAGVVAVLVSALFLRGRGAPMVVAVAVVPPMLVLGQVVPKALAQAKADRAITLFAPMLTALSWVLRPAVLFVGGFATILTRLFGTDRRRTFVSRDELALLIESDPETDKPDIEADEREMIANVFELGEYRARDLMVPLSEVTALPEDATIAEVAAEIADKQHSRLPVYRERVDDIVGMVHLFDVLGAGQSAEKRRAPISTVARQATYVPEAIKATELMRQLQADGQHIAVVVDEYGGAVGVVTVEDLLETIVGDIEDEYDAEPTALKAERPGVWRAAAKTPVARINQELEIALPESDDYETLAGLLIEHFRRIPDRGDKMTIGGAELEVVEASDRAVEMVRITKKKK